MEPKDTSEPIEMDGAGDIPEQPAKDIEVSNDSAANSDVPEAPALKWTEQDQALLDEIKHKRAEQESQAGSDATESARLKPAYLTIDNPPNYSKPHMVPATAIEKIDTLVDEKNAGEIAAQEYPNTPVQELSHNNLRGVAYEGMAKRYLEDENGGSNVREHPKGMTRSDGRANIEPDDVITDDAGNVKEIVDAKGYTRKDTDNPSASASSLTHMSNLENTVEKYVDADAPRLERVTILAPRETASMPQVQDRVAQMGQGGVDVQIKPLGTEVELEQRVEDLRKTDPADRSAISDDVLSELERVQALPLNERRAAMGELVLSLQNQKGNETTEGRNLRWETRIERNGDGITVIDGTGKEHTVWFKEDPRRER
jgi:hypothetical protein